MLDQFLTIFHNQLTWFEPIFSKPITNDNNNNSIVEYLFDSRSLIQDLLKPDGLLSFDDLLKKYKITQDIDCQILQHFK